MCGIIVCLHYRGKKQLNLFHYGLPYFVKRHLGEKLKAIGDVRGPYFIATAILLTLEGRTITRDLRSSVFHRTGG